jgi:hypothetical protein
MATTSKGIFYPLGTDSVNISGNLQTLAESVDTELDDYSTKTQTYSASAHALAAANNYTNAGLNSASNLIFSTIVNSAPETLDTLNELAAALDDDPSFATTVTNNLATKLSIASASSTYATIVSLSNASATVDSSALSYANSASAHAFTVSDAAALAKANSASANAAAVALGYANAAQTAAETTALGYANSASAHVDGLAQGYANTAQSNALGYANSASAHVDGLAQGYANTAQSNAQTTALGYANSASAHVDNLSQIRDNLKANLESPTFTGTSTFPTLSITTADTVTEASHYIVEISSDGIIRPKNLNSVRTEIVTTSAVNSASATVLGTVTIGTWNASNIALNRGGTNASLTAANGAVVYSAASALALTAVGTAGQVLTSNGAGAPTWQEAAAGGFEPFLLMGA